MQIAAGIDALQIFDSHGGHLNPTEFQAASGQWMAEIIRQLGGNASPGSAENGGRRNPVPVIVFSLGTHGNWPDLIASGADVLGVDWQSSLAEVRQVVPAPIALQGNLAPALLAEADPATVAAETRKVLAAMQGRPGHIFNLGHGLTPNAKLENIAALVETVKTHQ
jgi:uroporphyrinogen decarboxylase